MRARVGLVCVCAYSHVCVCAHVRVRAHARVCLRTCARACVRVCVRARVRACSVSGSFRRVGASRSDEISDSANVF